MTYREKYEEAHKEKLPEEACVAYELGKSHFPEWCGEDCTREDCDKCWDRDFPNK